jgi:hypothetical protein
VQESQAKAQGTEDGSSGDDDNFEINSLIGCRVNQDKTGYDYKVRWLGYGADADEWIGQADLSCTELQVEFDSYCSRELTKARKWLRRQQGASISLLKEPSEKCTVWSRAGLTFVDRLVSSAEVVAEEATVVEKVRMARSKPFEIKDAGMGVGHGLYATEGIKVDSCVRALTHTHTRIHTYTCTHPHPQLHARTTYTTCTHT